MRDLDGDGRADLLVSHASGGLQSAMNRTRIHRNRDGNFDLANPDQVFERKGGVAADELVDLDGDGRPEWLRVFMPFGLLQIAEIFVQRSIDVRAEIRRGSDDGRFEEKPWIDRPFSIPFDFETLRPRGFVPTLERDWNGDGHLDLLGSADGNRDRGVSRRRRRSPSRTAKRASRSTPAVASASATSTATVSRTSCSTTRAAPTSRCASASTAASSPARPRTASH